MQDTLLQGILAREAKPCLRAREERDAVDVDISWGLASAADITRLGFYFHSELQGKQDDSR